MTHRNCRLLTMLSIFSTIRTRRMGLWFVSAAFLANHLCSPIRTSRMGSSSHTGQSVGFCHNEQFRGRIMGRP